MTAPLEILFSIVVKSQLVYIYPHTTLKCDSAKKLHAVYTKEAKEVT